MEETKGKRKKPFYKRWWVWLLAIILIVAIANGGDEEDVASPPPEEGTENATPTEGADEAPAEEPEEEVYGIGQKATVADVGFTVNGIEETSEINSGNEFIENATTSGKFIIADITVENGKKEALTINSNYFKLVSADDVEYEATTDGTVMMAMGDAMNDFFLTQVNPGLSKGGKVVFEVPADLNIAEARLHCQTGAFGTESIQISLK
ncbi:DUF4352 domain-containing protein [Bacillus sp. PS06]|uniref:DUF4352 domain-containing protein n=1 Tax=Bacillus sp. PS06 TaxID=2764176 RepID=UPI00177C8E8C|nr:DUF4352 domain-containing protein [Bacillus sp. PS06]MBD8069379.1 DUF4352 domain-containing protein [Bacillus sp. PS06]